jgi:hypothetical protein
MVDMEVFLLAAVQALPAQLEILNGQPDTSCTGSPLKPSKAAGRVASAHSGSAIARSKQIVKQLVFISFPPKFTLLLNKNNLHTDAVKFFLLMPSFLH